MAAAAAAAAAFSTPGLHVGSKNPIHVVWGFTMKPHSVFTPHGNVTVSPALVYKQPSIWPQTNTVIMAAYRIQPTISKVTVQQAASSSALATVPLTDDLHVKIASSNDISLCALLLMATNKKPADWDHWAPIRFTFTWLHAVLTNLLDHDKRLVDYGVDETRALNPDQQRTLSAWLSSAEAMKALEIEAEQAADLARVPGLRRPAPAPAAAAAAPPASASAR